VLSSPASAATTISQSGPASGETVAGTAFTSQLAVTGYSGSVSFAQTSGSSSVSVSPSGAVTASASLAVGTYNAGGTDADSSGDGGSWAFTLTVIAPAPSNFVTTLVNVYQSEYSVDQLLSGTTALQSVSQYQSQVSQLNGPDLAVLYSETQQVPEWSQISALMDSIAADLSTISSQSQSEGSNATRSSGIKKSSANAPKFGALDSTGPPPVLYQHLDCVDPSAYNAAIYADQIAVDTGQQVYNIAASVEGAAGSIPIFGTGLVAAAAVTSSTAAAVLGAAQLAHDGLAYEQEVVSQCGGDDSGDEIDSIDNAAVQTYNLLATTSAAITALQTTDNATQVDVQGLSTQLTSLQGTISQTISTDDQGLQSSLQTTLGSDTQGLTGQLQTDVSALTSDSSSIGQDVTTLSQSVTANQNSDSSSLATDIANAVSTILGGVNSDAASLNSTSQQLLTTVNSDFQTQQTQFEQQLTLEIQNTLGSGSGTQVPVVQLMLPASKGGYLNAQPVGVQEVITNAFSSLRAIGDPPSNAAVTWMNTATADLGNGQWVEAYKFFVQAYQALS
jgi:hypothetical protein